MGIIILLTIAFWTFTTARVAFKLLKTNDKRYLPIEYGGSKGIRYNIFRNFTSMVLATVFFDYSRKGFHEEKYFNRMRYVAISASLTFILSFIFLIAEIIDTVTGNL